MTLQSPPAQDPGAQYSALTQGCGVVAFDDRTQIEVAGRDRVTFVHNLCTNDIKRLQPGQGCEAFLTTVQGHTLAHILVFATPQSLILETAAGCGPALLQHLDHYLISEDVQLLDRTAEWCEWLLAGAAAPQVLQTWNVTLPWQHACEHGHVRLDGLPVSVRCVPWFQGPSFQLVARREHAADLTCRLQQAGVVACTADAFHSVRIEAGFPWFPWDITERNLPQEIARDAQTISYNKGCYLGQETVARLDAVGHVNRRLAGLRCDGVQLPPAGTPLTLNDVPLGHVTSAAYSPRLAAPLALALLRVQHTAPGSRLTWAGGTAEVIALPLA